MTIPKYIFRARANKRERMPRTTLSTATLFVLLIGVTSSALLTLPCCHGVDAQSAANNNIKIPNSTYLDVTWVSWTLDWTSVGTSALGVLNCLIYGPTPLMMTQRLRGLRGQAGRSCSWTAHFLALLQDGDERVLDRADTPTGFRLDGREGLVLGLLWGNIVLAVIVLVAHLLAAIGLEWWVTKKAEARGIVAPPDPRSFFQKLLDISAKWGAGRALTGIVMLPIFAVFRISCIVIGARSDLPDAAVSQAWAALIIVVLILGGYCFGFPLLAAWRCTCEKIGGGDPDEKDDNNDDGEQAAAVTTTASPVREDTKTTTTARVVVVTNNSMVVGMARGDGEKKDEHAKGKEGAKPEDLRPLLARFFDDVVQWKFTSPQFDAMAVIAAAVVDPLSSLKWWWWPLAEMCFTAAIDLAPLSAGSYSDPTSKEERSCFAHALVGMAITLIFLVVFLLVRPYQKPILNWFFFFTLFTEFIAFCGAAIRESSLPISAQSKAEFFLWPAYIAAYTLVGASILFIVIPLLRRLRICSPAEKEIGAGAKPAVVRSLEEELLAMLSVTAASSSTAGVAEKKKMGSLFLKASPFGGARLSKVSLALPMLDYADYAVTASGGDQSSSSAAPSTAASAANLASVIHAPPPSAAAAFGNINSAQEDEEELREMFRGI